MGFKKATATKYGAIHLAYEKSNASLCMQYVGFVTDESIQDKDITCKRCLKAYEKLLKDKVE